eukprot:Lankesteria_metandrocarpae@DN11123_c0_g1_i1.p1
MMIRNTKNTAGNSLEDNLLLTGVAGLTTLADFHWQHGDNPHAHPAEACAVYRQGITLEIPTYDPLTIGPLPYLPDETSKDVMVELKVTRVGPSAASDPAKAVPVLLH